MTKETKDAELGFPVANVGEEVPQEIHALQRFLDALPTREQLPVILGLLFNSILNALPIAVFVLKIEEKLKVESMLAPAIAMAPMSALEFFSEWFHYAERLKKEPEIKLDGQQASKLLILTILVPALISSFVKGALTAMAGYEGNVFAQVGLAFLLGTLNMINTLLSGLIPIWKTLAAKYDLAPIDQQWLLKDIYTPANLRFLSEVYANAAPPIMGGMYGTFTYQTIKQNVPGIGGHVFAALGGSLAFSAGAVVTSTFDVELLRQQNAAREAVAQNQGANLVTGVTRETTGEGYTAMHDASTSSCQQLVSCLNQRIQILSGVDHSQLPKEFTGQPYLSFSTYDVAQGVNEFMTGQALNDLVQAIAKRANININAPLSAATLVVYGGGLDCLVNKAFYEYVVSGNGQATLGQHMYGVEKTAALSRDPYVIASIQVISAFAAFAAAYPKRELLGEGIAKRAAAEGSTTLMHSTNPIVVTVRNPQTQQVKVNKFEV